MHEGARHIAQHRRDPVGEGRAEQERELAAARLPGNGDKIIQRAHRRMQPVESAGEIFERCVRDVSRQARRAEIAECQRRNAARGPERRARLVDAATRAVEDHDGRMRALASRQEQRADEAVLDQGPAGDAVGHQNLGEAAGSHGRAADGGCERGLERPRHVGVEELALAFLCPDQAHGGDALVGSPHRSVPRQVDGATAVRNEDRFRPPEPTIARGLRSDGHLRARRQAGQHDPARHVDQIDRGTDREARGHGGFRLPYVRVSSPVTSPC